MKVRTIAVLCCSIMLPAAANAAPKQLYGKTVVISTTENRTHHAAGGGNPVGITASSVLSVYISAAGRPFVRSDRTIGVGRRVRSKAIDTAPDSGTIGVSTASNVQFAGSTMIVNMQFNSGGRRITATFDGSFTSCTATAINGREGNKPMMIRSRYSGQLNEVESIQTTVNGCSIREGNAFAG
jgi:hypothetical protein